MCHVAMGHKICSVMACIVVYLWHNVLCTIWAAQDYKTARFQLATQLSCINQSCEQGAAEVSMFSCV